jgi:hypothetical protein
MITTDHIVKGFFVNSAGTKVEFEGKVIRVYSMKGVLPMVEVDTPDGSMHSQEANAVVVGTWKAPKRKAVVMGTRTKVRGAAIKEGMTILVSEHTNPDGSTYLYPDHRITKATAAKVTGKPEIEMVGGWRRATRFYLIETTEGRIRVSSVQTITVVSND